MIKKNIQKFTNYCLKPFGAKVIKTNSSNFDMISALQRTHEHSIPLTSIIDIGASNGKWSLAAMDTFPDKYYLAIEPLCEHKTALQKLKIEHNHFDYILCVAGNIDNQEVLLNVADDLDGSTVNGIGGEQRKISVKTIDTIVSKKKLKGPFLLKFDTHGYEIPILKGAIDTLSKTNIIIMEVYNFKITDNSKRFHKMCSYLENLGFRCYDIAEPILRLHDNAFWQMDLFFCRSDSNLFNYSQYE